MSASPRSIVGRDHAVILEDLSEGERYAWFDELQSMMPNVWSAIGHNEEDQSVVVIPSVTLDRISERSGAMARAYEERFLFLLLLLRQPKLRLIYVTSQAIAPPIIEYYLALLPGVIPSHARARLYLVAVNDSSPKALSAKLLERPEVLRHVGSLIPNRRRSHLIPYNTTTLERDVALALGIPMYGADPRLFAFGTKSGCRKLFAEENVDHPLGREDVHSLDDILTSLEDMRMLRPAMGAAIVKLNEGVSGEGNARIDLLDVPTPGTSEASRQLNQRISNMTLESVGTSRNAYLAKLAERGGIVEEMLLGEVRSPSVQLRVTPLRAVEVLSTHDQVLGGPSGQAYVGCRFPADKEYSRLIIEPAQRIGERLAREGVLGRFAIDFVTVRQPDGSWKAFAIELNLRKGGTTHPFLTLSYLTEGQFDPLSGVYRAASGSEKFLVATDHLEASILRGLSVDNLFDIVARRGLHFDQARGAGIVFHMISSITECGLIGLTSIADSYRDADLLYGKAEQILLEEAEQAQQGIALSPLAP